MGSSTNNVKLGVCNVIFNGVNLGLTKGGVEVEVTTNTHEVKVDQYGDTAINELITGRMVKAKVPLAETTLENLVATMPGAALVNNGGAKATAAITFLTAAPVNNDKVTIAGIPFTFKTVPTAGVVTEIAIPGTITLAAAALANAINSYVWGYSATVAGAVVTVSARQMGTAWNDTVIKAFATPANLTVANLAGGTDPTAAKVTVPTGVSLSLLDYAQTLILRPRGTIGADDFTIHKAATPGALKYAYNVDNERVFEIEFKGYATDTLPLFTVGDVTAV